MKMTILNLWHWNEFAIITFGAKLRMIYIGVLLGCEFSCIIVSTVRANEALLSFDVRTGLGFVSNKKRTCVTMTR